jgi:hypothetical protein
VLVALPSSVAAESGVVVRGGAEFQVGRPPPPPRYRRRPGPRLMMPLRIDIGSISAGSDLGLLTGPELSVGVHWASLSPTPTNYDFGLGVFAGAISNGKLDETENAPAFLGLYADVARSLSRGDFWRTWASGRLEYLASDAFGVERTSLGASGKLEAELYISGVGVEPRGIFVGAYALGLYVEAAARRLSDDINPLQVGVGLSIRTPLVWVW